MSDDTNGLDAAQLERLAALEQDEESCEPEMLAAYRNNRAAKDMELPGVNIVDYEAKAELERLRSIEKSAAALIADIKSRHPGEELECPHLRAIDEALEPSSEISAPSKGM